MPVRSPFRAIVLPTALVLASAPPARHRELTPASSTASSAASGRRRAATRRHGARLRLGRAAAPRLLPRPLSALLGFLRVGAPRPARPAWRGAAARSRPRLPGPAPQPRAPGLDDEWHRRAPRADGRPAAAGTAGRVTVTRCRRSWSWLRCAPGGLSARVCRGWPGAGRLRGDGGRPRTGRAWHRRDRASRTSSCSTWACQVDGLDVTCVTALRQHSSVPIIMLTARVEESDKLVG